jgi:hypothetical protein
MVASHPAMQDPAIRSILNPQSPGEAEDLSVEVIDFAIAKRALQM